MAVTESNYTVSNSATTNYSFTFPYLKTTDVKLSINGVASTAWTFANATTIQLNSNPTVGDKLRIYRDTDDSKLEAEFFAGSAIKSSDLNDNFNQNLYVTQESNNKIDTAWTEGDKTIDSTETWDSLDTRVATTKAIDGRVDAKIDTALTTDVVGGQSITITDNSPGSGQITASVTAGSIRGTELAADAVNGSKIADDSIDSEHYVDGSIDTAHIGNAQVTTAKIADANVTTVKIADDAITNAKIANDAVSTNEINTAAITTSHFSSGCVTNNVLAADSVTNAKIADNSIDSEQYVDGSIDHVHLSNDCIDGDNVQDNAINTEHIAANSITTTELDSACVYYPNLSGDCVGSLNIMDNAVDSEHIAAGALDNEHYAAGSITSDKLNGATVITNSEQSGASANDTSFFTSSASDARYFNVSSGDTIKNGDTFPDNDTTIATTAAINDRIIDLVDDVGGFVPIANETSFPFTNPDVNNGAGTLVSIKALASNLTSNGSGVATISNATIPGGSTVTINGLENSTTYSAGFGMIVETTTTTSTYTFHRLVPKATEVSTVAGSISNVNAVGNNTTNINTVAGATSNISTVAGSISNVNNVGGSIANVNTVASNLTTVNDFAARYRVSGSAPTSSLDAGDLYFDTTGNELKVYNGSAWQGGVTATGNLLSKSGDQMTGNLTFSGSQTVDGRDVSVDGTKLDGIETNATADQTAAEIVTLVADQTIAPSTIDMEDNEKIKLGTGDDLEIYHDGTHTYLDNQTGLLSLRNAGQGNIYIQPTHGEYSISAKPNGAVELYYDNSKKFETGSGGISVTGGINLTTNLSLLDNGIAKFGTGDDLQIYHNGDSYITNTTATQFAIQSDNLRLRSTTDHENYIVCTDEAGVEIYWDGSKKFETTSSGVAITGVLSSNQTSGQAISLGDSAKLHMGAGDDLELYHNGSYSVIMNKTGVLYYLGDTQQIMNQEGSETMATFNENGAVALYYDNVKKFETDSGGVVFGDDFFVTDNNIGYFGSGNDLQIKHDGTNSSIKNLTGHLILQSDSFKVTNNGDTESIIRGTANGNVELYYDNVKKFYTGSAGVAFVGDLYGNDNEKVRLGDSQDLEIFHNGTYSAIRANTLYLQDNNGSGHAYITCLADGAVGLRYDNSQKLQTESWGVNITGNCQASGSVTGNELTINGTTVLNSSRTLYNIGTLELADSIEARFGTGNDLRIYHNGSHNYIIGASGQNTYIGATNGEIQLQPVFGSQHGLRVINGGAVEAYYDGSKKLETTSGGINVTGAITVNGAALGGGLSVADYWLYNSGNSVSFGYGNSPDLGSGNWSKIHSATSSVTSCTSDSRAVFSFPSTGMYRVECIYDSFGQAPRYTIQNTTDNGSNWSDYENASYASAATENEVIIRFWNCTNISNDKLRFYIYRQSGNSSVANVRLIFTKLN